MSDEKITHVDVTPKGAAFAAVRDYVGQHQGQVAGQHYPGMIAAAVDAWCSAAKIELTHTTVRLLRPAPGDTVLLHVEEFALTSLRDREQWLQPLRDQHPGVLFAVAECVEGVTIVRPQGRQEAREARRHAEEAKSDG